MENLYLTDLGVIGKAQTNLTISLVREEPSTRKRTGAEEGIAKRGRGMMIKLEKKISKGKLKNEN